ncbi:MULTISPECIES: SPW repeat domain-containing protein [Methylosinus]|uniref:SPW repeat-containing integral membrane domain-containing protein n=1 Tax=Methylosinus sporium TaxID=428 RepID=A0A2U1SLH5_METSR|nr:MULTISPECIES: hypothetical protein [Methylosinus]MBU3888695.1 hypothetical protein [Methylosinus sp. KRF6]PWB92464.1 hypothetical protein C5689_18055 [Methylosinus sporium]TRL27773.1 hypothetical protein FM996_18640 [Methylosinus sporium]
MSDRGVIEQRGNGRGQFRGRPYDIACLVLGGIVCIAPWLFGYHHDVTAAAASWIAGSFIVVAAAIALTSYTRLFREVNVVLGALTAFAPWLLRFEHNVPAAVALGALGGLVAFIAAAELLFWPETDSGL